MDTSEIYIKMMGEAWPLLKDEMPIGSIIFSRRLRMLYVLDGEVVHWRDKVNTSNMNRAFPLLEQDQLQEMVTPQWKKTGDFGKPLITKFYEFAMSFNPQPFREEELPLQSWEQLWLAFVMKELHSKEWKDGWH